MPLTDTAAKNAKPKEKPYKLADGEGMYLEVAPGGGKWWRLKYRFGGKEKRISLGVYPDVSVKDARERRDEAKRLLAGGIDPSTHRKITKTIEVERDTNTFEAIAREWFAKFSPDWAASHGEKILRRLERDIFPRIGSRPIREIEPPELLACLRRIEERGAIETAHRAKQSCGQVFQYAIATGRAGRNPAKDITGALATPKTEHYPAITDPKAFAVLLRDMDGYGGSLIVRNALQLSALLFVRPGELRAMQWSDLALDAEEWRYLITKTKTQHLVPLPRQALALLRELQPLTGHSRYVFPSERGASRPISENTVNVALINLGYKDKHCAHGFRGTARTILDEVLNWRPDYIEHQLAHAVKDPNGRAYNRTAHLPARKEMMQAWADYLDGLRKGADVVSINSKRA